MIFLRMTVSNHVIVFAGTSQGISKIFTIKFILLLRILFTAQFLVDWNTLHLIITKFNRVVIDFIALICKHIWWMHEALRINLWQAFSARKIAILLLISIKIQILLSLTIYRDVFLLENIWAFLRLFSYGIVQFGFSDHAVNLIKLIITDYLIMRLASLIIFQTIFNRLCFLWLS